MARANTTAERAIALETSGKLVQLHSFSQAIWKGFARESLNRILVTGGSPDHPVRSQRDRIPVVNRLSRPNRG